ncbi:hypothetical protein L6164_006767 [Bauhinia variegata]|uniref:Uncharacterized protein n=1 Tax=Bauhinia variegata TaxID=167791 RepID=A0ACB9PVG0_BAUVA|nr:hypothetical protein L6164_006767 [Bauhinia variegata]
MENFRILTIMSMVIMIMYPLEVMGDPGPTLHKLGGSKGWNPNQDVNYTAWSAQEHFYVGDWLRKCTPLSFLYSALTICD